MGSDILVSIVVVSYNAESTIVETLNSIMNQTYNNIELIVADDCSKDDTVSIAQKWLEENSKRFVRTKLLCSSFNQGVCKNLNNGHKEVQGEWVMCPAADDILLPNCITDYVDYILTHSDSSFISSYMSVYDEEFKEENCITRKKGPTDLSIFDASLEQQLTKMAYSPFVWAPTIIYKKDLFEAVGGFREEYPFEDWPFYMDVLENGFRISFVDRITVGYRYHQSSSHEDNMLFNYKFTLKTKSFIRERCFKYYSPRQILATKARWNAERILHLIGCDKKTWFNTLVFKCTFGFIARIGGI